MRAAPHIQHRRPNDWVERAQNVHKHSLGLCDEDYASAHSSARCARKVVRSTTYAALAPEGLYRFNPKLVQKPIGAMATSY
jgi:hypothetical protein